MNLIINALILTSLFVLTQSQDFPHTWFGNYTQINSTLCGLAKESMKFTDKCFEWHKSKVSELSAARSVMPGEAPWTVLIDSKHKSDVMSIHCTGALIDQQWVLSSGHCFSPADNVVKVYPGYAKDIFPTGPHYSGRSVFIHPNYTKGKSIHDTKNDIALIWLSQKIPILRERDYNNYRQNTICLPEKGITNIWPEYVMIAGWGSVRELGLPLQLGHRRIESMFERHIIRHHPINDSNIVCPGDSGAPLWQYANGRAVLIGVQSKQKSGSKEDVFGCTYSTGMGVAVRVSVHIDWILKTIRDNRL